MLSSNTASTPRPAPPAKSRSKFRFPNVPPPPPYELSEDRAAAAPSPVPARLLRQDSRRISLPAHPGNQWNERSREELSGLLLKADELIKSRETDLSFTSALCKTLYEDNMKLKSKHDNLLSRLPSTGTPSPSPSVPASPSVSSPMLLSPNMYPEGAPPSPVPLLPGMRTRHTRRISVTPAELASLADQNVELLEQLEKLEVESQHADQTGKRKLRKLEQEIQVLREELERTQARAVESEQQAKAASRSAEEVQRRKEAREERLKALKKLTGTSEATQMEPRDFAPPPEIPNTRIFSSSTKPVPEDEIPENTVDLPPLSDELQQAAKEDESEGSVSDAHTTPTNPTFPDYISGQASLPPTEGAITSQLLIKIRELEEANAQIVQNQRETDQRLLVAQREAESIRRLYECLTEGAEVELQVISEDADLSDSAILGTNGTIKFSSLRKTLDSDLSLSDLDSDPFASDISKEMQSTARSALAADLSAQSHKVRKSVVGLFDQGPGPSSVTRPPTMKLDLSPTPSEAGGFSSWSTAATDGVNLVSPSFSTLQTPLEGPGFGRTLGSELGSELGDTWGQNVPSHHLRTTSLYGLVGLDTSRDGSLSTFVSPSDERPSFIFPQLDASDADTSREEIQSEAGPSTPPPATGPMVNIQPATPTPERVRAQRLSQTMLSRTNRWVQRRYTESPEKPPRSKLRRSTDFNAAAAHGDPDQSLDVIPLGFSMAMSARSSRKKSLSVEAERRGDVEDADTSALQLRDMSQPQTTVVEVPKQGFPRLMFEALLWIQFAIVIFVFLWTMARKGPKVVLEEAEQRRVQRRATLG